MAGLYMGDHTNTSRKSRNCSRLSEPLTVPPNYYSTLSETSIKEPERKMERCKLEANRVYDALIQMGERSTRSIRPILIRDVEDHV